MECTKIEKIFFCLLLVYTNLQKHVYKRFTQLTLAAEIHVNRILSIDGAVKHLETSNFCICVPSNMLCACAILKNSK